MTQANGAETSEAAVGSAKVVVGRTRSPNYPVYKLETALKKAEALHAAFKLFPVPIKSAAEKLGFTVGSSTAAQAIATLKAYGLIDVQGSGDNRKVAVTENVAKILANHRDKTTLIKTAALAPKIHQELHKLFVTPQGLAPDETISSYLQFDREEGKFNQASIDPLLRQFKATLEFAGLNTSANISEDAANDPAPLAIGDWVQWTSQGQMRFAEPRKVTAIQDYEGEPYAFVEGEATGVPVAELAKVDAPAVQVNQMTQAPPNPSVKTPPVNPGFKPAAPQRDTPTDQKDFPLYLSQNKRAVLYVPTSMTIKDYQLLKKQIENHLMVIEATSVEEPDGGN